LALILSMAPRTLRLTRFLLILLIATTFTGVAAAEAETTEATPDPAAAAATPEEPVAVELPPLECSTPELLESIDSWSVDCVALWLENLGFADLRVAFTGNKINGTLLKSFTMDKLSEDYGVSDADQRRTIIYSLKDVVSKDNSSGNTNHYWQMLMWVLPFAAVYYYLSLKYEKQIAKLQKRYKKWQDAKNPPKAPEPVYDKDGNSEWITGVNNDIGTKKDKKERKEEKKARSAEKKAAAAAATKKDE